MDRLVEVVDLLRRSCPWTAALDHASLLHYLVEETYELYEAVDDVSRSAVPDAALLGELRDELGDLLFQVVLHAQLQSERGTFALADVAEALTAKLVRRNPHVFSSDGALRQDLAAGGSSSTTEEIVAAWRAVKQREKPSRTSPFDGIPPHLPALAFAAKTLDRAAEQARATVRSGSPADGSMHGAAGAAAGEPTDETSARPAGEPVPEPVDEEAQIGAEMLSLTRRAVSAGIDPERALRRAVLDLQRRVSAGG